MRMSGASTAKRRRSSSRSITIHVWRFGSTSFDPSSTVRFNCRSLLYYYRWRYSVSRGGINPVASIPPGYEMQIQIFNGGVLHVVGNDADRRVENRPE